MANRGDLSRDDFITSASALAERTLAFHLADSDVRPAVKQMFHRIAEYVCSREDSAPRLATYSKTLLGVENAMLIEAWLAESREAIRNTNSDGALLDAFWPLFLRVLDNRLLETTEPADSWRLVAQAWLPGTPYSSLFGIARSLGMAKPWGSDGTRNVSEDDILNFCESTLGFDCALILGGAAQVLRDSGADDGDLIAQVDSLQVALKCGLIDPLATSFYNTGFPDRVIAQELSRSVRAEGAEGLDARTAFTSHRDTVSQVLLSYPSYFETSLASLS